MFVCRKNNKKAFGFLTTYAKRTILLEYKSKIVIIKIFGERYKCHRFTEVLAT